MPTMLRVLVLGANGFIGRSIVRSLASDPRVQLKAGVRRPSQESGGVAQVVVDATDAASIKRACEEVDVVVFALAGTESDMRQAVANVCQAVQSLTPAPLLIFLSSISVYGAESRLVDEESSLALHAGSYGEMKISSENLVKTVPHWLILRPGIVYGPGSSLWTFHVGDLIAGKKINLTKEEMSASCNAIFVDDLARTVKESIFSPETRKRIFNVVGQDTLTWDDFFCQHALALKAPWPHREKSVLKRSLGDLFDRASFVLRKLRPVPEAGRQFPPRVLRPWLKDQCRQGPAVDSSKIREVLSMPWTPIELGISQSMPWLTEQLRRSSSE